MSQDLRVFEILGAEGEWILAKTRKQALNFWIEEHDSSEDLDPFEDVKLLTAEELNSLEYFVDGSETNSITFRERLDQLIDEDARYPAFFSKTS